MTTELPARLRCAPPSPEEVERFSRLCDRIGDCAVEGDSEELCALLAEWNARASRPYEATEFRTYYEAMAKDVFVGQALAAPPPFIEDLTFDEAARAAAAIMRAEVSEVEVAHLLGLLETNLPGSEISDLIYWPNVWFRDDAMLHAELTPELVIGYAMARSGRRLAGTPDDLRLSAPRAPIPR